MSKILALIEVLRKGSSVADPALWKNRSAAAIALAGVLAALIQLAKAYGYELPVPLTHDELLAIAGGVATVVGLFVTYGTSDKVGLLPPKDGADPDPSDRYLPPSSD
jgi:hypothetical protein